MIHDDYKTRVRGPVFDYATYIARQELLREDLPKYEHIMQDKYAHYSDALQKEAEAYLTKKLDILLKDLDDDQKIGISLVDLQRGFTYANFGLQAPGGENVILTNAAFLDALKNILDKNPEMCKKIELVVTQDAHVSDREKNQNADDAKIIADAFPLEVTRKSHADNEVAELTKIYGQHCIIGTPDVGLPQLLEEKLAQLKAFVPVIRFGKMTFGPGSALKLNAGVELDDKKFLEGKHAIFDSKGVTYADYMRKFKHVFLTGICSDVCVQEAAVFLAQNLGVNVDVLDAFVHQLVLPGAGIGKDSYEQVLTSIQAEYDKVNSSSVGGLINFTKFSDFRSNPELLAPHARAQRFVVDTNLRELCQEFCENVKTVCKPENSLTNIRLNGSLQDAIAKFLKNNDVAFDVRRQNLLEEIQAAIKTEESVLNKHPQWKALSLKFLSLIASVLTLFVFNIHLNKSVFGLFTPKTQIFKDAEKLEARAKGLLAHSFYATDVSVLEKKPAVSEESAPVLN